MKDTPLSAALTHLRTGDTSINTFGAKPYPHKWSITTKVDIFDVRNGTGELRRDLDESELRRQISV